MLAANNFWGNSRLFGFAGPPRKVSNMQQYSTTVEIARPLDEMFAFLSRPTNLARLAPPDFHLELVEGPEVMELGSRLVWKGRRWGIPQKLVQEVTTFVAGKLIVEEQRKGPFPRWIHAHHFAATAAGTQLREDIQFEPPGGIVGLMINADFIRKDLDKMFAFRATKLKELFG